MKIAILCTLGPASMDPGVIRGLDERGVDLFRINLSHTPLEAVEETIGFVRSCSDTPICLDTEGPQVRCGRMASEVVLVEGARVSLTAELVEGTQDSLPLWPRSIFDALVPGSVLSVDFDGASLLVTEVGSGEARAVVRSGGRVRSNKAVTVDPAPSLPALSEKDLAAIEIGARWGIGAYALSFASDAEDVARLRRLAPEGAFIIAKIESRAGVRNMDAIIAATDAALIDRGDLSREVPLEHVPYYQKAIVRRANRWNRPVYVATNLLESMVTSQVPTIAEANDLANTLLDGVHGLVLAAETAVGVDPVGSVDMVLRAVRAFERASQSQLLEEDRGPVELPGSRATAR
ncbi:MAG TPA: pyruvate kinase [Actinomycetota bacterium]|nr:pyruvate kinase [Actinomycetota bacterium]